MGTYIIKTPDIGEGIAEVELVAWHVQAGEVVSADQVLADVMTDKATVEIPSPVAGKVLALSGNVGQTMAVGSELVRLEVAGAGNLKEGASAAPLAPAALAIAPAERQDVRVVAAPVAVPVLRPAGERPIASPAVRRRAWEMGVELERVTATGSAGRVMQSDLEAYARRHPGAPPAAQRVDAYARVNTQQDIPVIGLRRKIAVKMQESKRRIPHFTYVEEIDVTELEVLRERLNNKPGQERPRVTLLPLLVRAMVLALRVFPQLNARFDDDKGVVTRHGAVHLGIATQTANGLMVPVLRHAEALDLWACAVEVARLAEAARTGQVTREELSGSTITLTSLGTLGGIVTTPVINHPEVAIVGVNRIVERPVVRRGVVVVRQMMNLSSSFDHRVVDGMDAARFVQALRGYLEVPSTLFVE